MSLSVQSPFLGQKRLLSDREDSPDHTSTSSPKRLRCALQYNTFVRKKGVKYQILKQLSYSEDDDNGSYHNFGIDKYRCFQ